MIRSYRQRGHLIAKLDPLGLLKADYLDELHPESYGFRKEEYDDKIFLDGVINSCLLYTSPSPRDYAASRMPSSA